METVVVGYDGSEHAKRALERTADLARAGASVVVVNVASRGVGTREAALGVEAVDPLEAAERGRELEEAAAYLAGRGVQARAVQAAGDAAVEIVARAREAGADLIVVGTRGLNVAQRLVLGSVSTKVVHEAPCDVLVVR